MDKLSVTSFAKMIKEQIEKICREKKWEYSKELHRGNAFQIWIANIIASYEQFFETDIEDAVILGAKDLNADIYFEDSTNKQILICQCKYSSLSDRKNVNEDELVSFYDRHIHYMDKKWVEKHGSKDASYVLSDYSDKIKDGYSVVFRFVTTGNSTERTNEIADNKNCDYQNRNINVKCELMDFSLLKDYYLRATSLEETIPEEVVFYTAQSELIYIQEPYKTIIGIVKGNELRGMYAKYKESLFAYNIRNYLGNRGINSDIKITATECPDNFIYFNNGISAICTHLEIDKNKITANKFQIINGAQTVGTIAKCPESSALKVLFRLTEGESVKTEKGFNQKIIQYNNTQNVIKISDFRSNDEIQLHIEKKFRDQKPNDIITNKIKYMRKRKSNRSHGEITIKLEDFAKIRYSYFYEPTKCLSQPKALWTPEEEGGVYEKVFGIDGKIESQWSEEEFLESLVAIALDFKFIETCKELSGKSKDFLFLSRLEWHSLALSGIFRRIKMSNLNASQLVKNKNYFNNLWDGYWSIAKNIIIDSYESAMEDKITIFNFVRNMERWDRMKKRMERMVLM